LIAPGFTAPLIGMGEMLPGTNVGASSVAKVDRDAARDGGHVWAEPALSRAWASIVQVG
jgi:hypothetical protein